MITELDDAPNNERSRLAWALAASAVLNIFLWTISVWLFATRTELVHQNEAAKFIVASTSIRIEHRTIPQPQHEPTRTIPAPAQPQVTHRVQRQPPTQREEISRYTPDAPPAPRVARKTVTFAQTLALQEQEFARESKAMHENNNPLSIATIAPQPPAAFRRSFIDISGNDQQERVSAVLRVLSKFTTDTLHCYYVHYDAQFSGGGTDDGNIPWPVCYPKDHDAMLPLDRVHSLPIPAPQPGYVLPPGDALTPLLQNIYTGKIHT